MTGEIIGWRIVCENVILLKITIKQVLSTRTRQQQMNTNELERWGYHAWE